MRSFSGRAVVVGALLLAAGGAVVLNLSIRSENRAASESCRSRHARVEPDEAGGTRRRVLDRPLSRRAAPGVPCRVTLLAPCVPYVDYDARFWVPLRAWRSTGPLAPATVTLVAPRQVELTTPEGDTIELRPHRGPLTVPACPAPSQ